MAKTVINPEAELVARPGDVDLSLEQLALLSAIASLKKAPTFEKFPGYYVLRQFRAGEVICRQGDAGGTAFYLLTAKDAEALTGPVADDGPAPPALDRATATDLAGYAAELRRRTKDDKAPVATAMLIINSSSSAGTSTGRSWWKIWGGETPSGQKLARPTAIANDGPTDIDYQTRRAALFAGEVFGEMSCRTQQPRSATVVADVDCFALEFLRVILDQMQKDPDYKKQIDEKYRDRVMEGHLRQLSIFKLLSDQEFSDVANQVELKELAPGTVMWDEGDEADALYVVRSGIVQVVQSYPWLLTEKAVSDWPKLLEQLRTSGSTSPAIQKLLGTLDKDLQKELTEPSDPPPADLAVRIVENLNKIAETDALLSAKEWKDVISGPAFTSETSEFPKKVKDWTGLQIRRGTRFAYHVLFPEVVAPPEPLGTARVIQYVSRGGVLGEIGAVLKLPRSATCMAYSHPDMERASTNVELVRVPAEVIRKLYRESPKVAAEIDRIAAVHKERDRTRPKSALAGGFQSRRVEELGLQQGQKLMLIDLDRCTRCGDCVKACIDTHDDGHSRLYLDGPRFGKYLVPSACRQCRDPICMIGCPVSSIQLGDGGEIVIREWCIGCGMCADQCPYDSIQMHDIGIVPESLPGWRWTADLSASESASWMNPKFDASNWNAGATPFKRDVGLQLQLAADSGSVKSGKSAQRMHFRHTFAFRAAPADAVEGFKLTATSQSPSVQVYLNGKQLELTQDVPQKKRGLFVCRLNGDALQPGENVLAAVVDVPGEFGADVFTVRIDRRGMETALLEEKGVTERAVVCDQCSSLSGNRAACVYACPHEAAMRVDAWVELPTM